MTEDLKARLRDRQIETLPKDWKKDRLCPECGASAERQKCMWDMGGGCPRHDAGEYEPSPYVYVPDPLCTEAADRIEELERLLQSKEKISE